MNTAWRPTTLGGITHRITKGTTPTTLGAAFTVSGVNFVKVESISGSGSFQPDAFAYIDASTHERLLARSRLEEGDVLFSIAGAIGRTAIVRREILPANTNQAVAILRPRTDLVMPEFLFYLLRSGDVQEHAAARIVQSVQANVSLGELSKTPILLPPLAEQLGIAEVLGALDDKVDLNRQMNRTLEEMASALFKSWFVDLDPVVAKADGRQPFAMDARTAALFPSTFTDGAPTSWRWSTIGAEVSVMGGSTPSTANSAFWDGAYFWCTPRDMSKLVAPVVLDTERRITDAGVASISSGLLPAGTVLLSSRAPIGYTAITAVPLAINQGFIAMVCDKALSNHFVLRWTRANMDEVESRAGGTTFAEISKSAFRPIPVLVPTREVLRAYDTRASMWHELVVHNVRESRTLTTLRDTLLPKLLSGEVRLKQAETLVEAAL